MPCQCDTGPLQTHRNTTPKPRLFDYLEDAAVVQQCRVNSSRHRDRVPARRDMSALYITCM